MLIGKSGNIINFSLLQVLSDLVLLNCLTFKLFFVSKC